MAEEEKEWKPGKLTKEEERIAGGGTEMAYTGEYDNFYKEGTYVCRRCGAPLYESKDKFDAHCGWPAFDDEIKGAVKHSWGPGGMFGIEVHCANCGAHLGHIFEGEHFTEKNVRHCINSLAMKFIPKGKKLPEVIKYGKDKK